MKILVSIIVAVLAFSLFSFSFLQQAYSLEEEGTGYVEDDGTYYDDGTNYDDGSSESESNSESDSEVSSSSDTENNDESSDNNNNDDNNNDDKSETNSKDNDPCDLHGRDICDENGDCDDNNFDCLTDLGDGNYCTTGMCPGDDKEKESDKKPKPDKYGDNHCDDSYPNDCIPSPPPDLNCGDDGVPNNIKVEGDDPHGFDGNDNDGIGCESGSGSGGGSGGNNKCIFPECYYPIPGNPDKAEDDKCKWPECYYPISNNNKKKSSNSNNDNDNDNNNNKKSNSNSNSNSDSNVKKFEVKVILDNVTTAESDEFSMRVIVYGPHTLNKPTLDKPGQLVNVQGCGLSCHTEWGFTAWKVPVGSEIQACVWNSNTGQQNCGYGKSHSTYGPEIIRVSLPSLS